MKEKLRCKMYLWKSPSKARCDLSGDRQVSSLALDGKLPEFGNELGNLLLLSSIRLVLEFVHSYVRSRKIGCS